MTHAIDRDRPSGEFIRSILTVGDLIESLKGLHPECRVYARHIDGDRFEPAVIEVQLSIHKHPEHFILIDGR